MPMPVTTKILAGLTLAAGLAFGLGAIPSVARAQAPAPAASETESTLDVLVMKDGRRVEGTILSETGTTIKFKGKVAGIEFETEYLKSEILEIRRATKKAPASTSAAEAKGGTPADPKADASEALPPAVTSTDPDAKKVYIIPVHGIFGEDISQTPILQAMKDATAQKADIVIISLDAKALINPRTGESFDEDMAWDLTSRLEQIFPVFTEQMPKEWAAAGITPPRVALVCRRAIGAAAFFPLGFKEVYFRSDGIMGGIGGLAEMFGQTGDDVVREKQRSLRLGHVQGWAVKGGYNPEIVRAMSRREHVLTMKLSGGKAELFERMPEDPSEELLTDDGAGTNADGLVAFVEGSGNDVLTLNARLAQLLGISKGTIDSEEDLILTLGAGRNAVVTRDRGEKIMKNWSRSLQSAKRQIMKLLDEYREARVEPPNNYESRTKFRGVRKQKLTQVKALMTRWGEGLDFWGQMNGIPSIPQLETLIERIGLEQMADKPEPR
jgi:uncharacterized protein YuzE